MNKTIIMLAAALLLGCSSTFAEDGALSLVVELADGSTCNFDYYDVFGYSVTGNSLHIDTCEGVAAPVSFEIQDIRKLSYLSENGVSGLPATDFKLEIRSGAIIIRGLAAGTECIVAKLDGVVIATSLADSAGCVSLQNLDTGFYCVSIGGKTSVKIRLI